MLNKDSILMIKGKKTTIEEFKNKFAIDTTERALVLAETLVKKGKATIHVDKSEEKEIIDELEADQLLTSIIDQLDEEEYASKKAKREETKADTDLVSIKLVFNTTNEAVQAETWINGLGIEDTEISIKAGAINLIIKDITPQEYSKIAMRYQADKAISKTVEVASKTLVGATDTVNYVATKVVAPTAKIAGEATLNLSKGLLHTTVKVGAGLVNSTSKAVEDTKVAMATDTELIRAKKELVDAKDGLVSFFRQKTNKAKKRSGIEVI